MAATGSGQPALALEGVSKSFGSTRALDDVSFSLRRGSIHALLGGNGSGKSTLIKVLAGVHRADSGRVTVDGVAHRADATSPGWARAAHLHVVHQHMTAFPDLSVAENLQLGRGYDTDAVGRVRWRALRRRAEAVLKRFGIAARADTPMWALSRASQTMVAIARALQDQEGAHEGVLILDEPTSSLPAPEVDLLLEALQRYAAEGQTILFVTHRFEEVMRIADTITMLRDGRHVATRPRSEVSHAQLVELMVGRPLEAQPGAHARARKPGPVALDVRDLSAGPVYDARFAVRAGEVVGLAGLLGSGRSSLLKALFGALPRHAGTIALDGAELELDSTAEAIAAGIAYVPEDRAVESVFSSLSVTENLSAAVVPRYWRRGHLAHRAERGDARRLIAEFGVKAASERAALSSLSGGNQQKVVLARWLRRRPRLILLDEPTQGVDVGARVEIYRLIEEAVTAGAAVLVASSEFEELEALCDRALVLRAGRVVGEVPRQNLSAERLERLAQAEASA